MILQQKEEINKRNKVKENKPYVYQKMLKFTEKISRGESIAIIQFQYNYACNFRCEHCCVSRLQNNKRIITMDNVKELSKRADKLGLARFVITGGEPLVFNDFDQLVEAIDPQKFYINCDTNGWFLDRPRIQHLKEIGVDRIQLSIDSLDADEHDKFRHAKGSHVRAMHAVDLCIEEDMDIFIQTVVTRQRLYTDEFTNFIEYFNKKDIGVFVTFAKPVGAWEGNFDAMVTQKDLSYFRTLEQKYKLFSHLTPAYGLNRGCAGCWNIITVTPELHVYPCPYLQVSMGNLLKEPLSVILDRCMRLKPMRKYTCLLAEDKDFVEKYLVKHVYGKHLPVMWDTVFAEEDFLKRV